jgi:hypothetical protein
VQIHPSQDYAIVEYAQKESLSLPKDRILDAFHAKTIFKDALSVKIKQHALHVRLGISSLEKNVCNNVTNRRNVIYIQRESIAMTKFVDSAKTPGTVSGLSQVVASTFAHLWEVMGTRDAVLVIVTLTAKITKCVLPTSI